MRTIERRLRKLEESFARKKNDQGPSPGEQIRARRRRRAEAAGESFVEEPTESVTDCEIKADRFLMLNRHEHDAQKGSGFAIETSRELRLVIEGEDNR